MFATRAAAVAVAGVVLTLVALVFDAAPLFVPAVAFVAIGVLTPAWVWLTARGAHVRRVLHTERVIEDVPLEASIEVRRGPLGLPGAEVVDPFTGSRLVLAEALAPLRGDNHASVTVVTRFGRRGLHTLPAPTLLVSDPLELARVRVQSDDPAQQLLVLPRTEPVRWLRAGRGRHFSLTDGRAHTEAMAAVDLDGLRPYRPGTSASRIHWPAVARGAGLIERRLQADGDSRPLVVLDARTASPSAPPELLDAAVRAAASLALDLARGGGCGLLLPGEQRATVIDRELISWPAAHARLALVSGGAATRAPALGPSVGRQGPLVYVAAAPVQRLIAVLNSARAGGGAVVLVTPDRGLVGGRPPGLRITMTPTLRVAGCQGFVLGAGRESKPAAQPNPEPTAA
jgi:uncharacterized protein (DUF58 family)